MDYKKEQDLMFQEIEEKASLQERAMRYERLGERAPALESAIRAAGVQGSVISDMMNAGKTYKEIVEFLAGEIRSRMVERYVAYRAARGKRISEEEARQRIDRLFADDDSE